MSRQQSDVTDRWHTSTGPPCPGGGKCRGADTAPSARHGQGLRWAATWSEVIDGQRSQRTMLFQYREAAVDHQRTMRNAMRDKSLPPGLRMRGGAVTVAGFFPRFMTLTARDRSTGSHGKIRSQFTRMIDPYLGHRDLAELQYQPGEIREWQARLREGMLPGGQAGDGKAYAASTVGEAFALLSAIFTAALGERDTRVGANPCQHPQARPAKADRSRRRGRPANWTAAKVAQAYLAPMPDTAIRGSLPAWDRYRCAVLLAATCGGMRLGEVMGLDVDDIHWDRQTITMNYSLARDSNNGSNHYREGKSEAAQRTMTASPLALAALRAHMDRYPPITVRLPLETMAMYGRPVDEWERITRHLIFSTGASGLVCDPAYQSAARYGLSAAGLIPKRPITSRATRDDSTGQYVPNGGIQRPHRVTERYEKPSDHGLHFHALRTFFVSLLHENGVPDVIIKAEVGHESLASIRGTGFVDDVTSGYTRPLNLADKWQPRIRKIITDEFAPLLPGLAIPHGGKVTFGQFGGR